MSTLKWCLCLQAALVLAPGAVMGPPLSAQTHGQGPANALLGTADLDPSGVVAAAPSADVVAPMAAPRELSPELIGDTDVARQRYQAAIAVYAKAPQMTAILWDKTGIAYQMLLDFKDAIRCYQEALKLNPSYAEVMNNLGTAYAIQNDYGQADRMYRMALKLEPDSAVFLRNFGTNLLAEHKYAEGWEAYQQALAIDPTVFTRADGPIMGNSASLKERAAMFYYQALGCVRVGDVDCALESLRRAMDKGFASAKKISADKGFASLHNNPAFQQLLAEQRSQ